MKHRLSLVLRRVFRLAVFAWGGLSCGEAVALGAKAFDTLRLRIFRAHTCTQTDGPLLWTLLLAACKVLDDLDAARRKSAVAAYALLQRLLLLIPVALHAQ